MDWALGTKGARHCWSLHRTGRAVSRQRYSRSRGKSSCCKLSAGNSSTCFLTALCTFQFFIGRTAQLRDFLMWQLLDWQHLYPLGAVRCCRLLGFHLPVIIQWLVMTLFLYGHYFEGILCDWQNHIIKKDEKNPTTTPNFEPASSQNVLCDVGKWVCRSVDVLV